MSKKSKETIRITEVEICYNENRVPLKPTTKVFEMNERDDAVDCAHQRGSYVGSAYANGELVGWYVPA